MLCPAEPFTCHGEDAGVGCCPWTPEPPSPQQLPESLALAPQAGKRERGAWAACHCLQETANGRNNPSISRS